MLPQVHQFVLTEDDTDVLREYASEQMEEVGSFSFRDIRDAATFALAFHLGQMSPVTYFLFGGSEESRLGIDRIEVQRTTDDGSFIAGADHAVTVYMKA